LFASFPDRFVQVPLQFVCPLLQVVTQLPELQTCPEAQRRPH
jgi:hypothetical protein